MFDRRCASKGKIVVHVVSCDPFRLAMAGDPESYRFAAAGPNNVKLKGKSTILRIFVTL